MAAEPKRLFSSAGYVINDRRNRLQIDTIQAFECLKSWYMLGESVVEENILDFDIYED